MAYRVTLAILLLLSIMFAPFWLSVILVLAGTAYFPSFYEGIVIFFIGDMLYGAKTVSFHGITYLMTVLALILVLGGELLKKKLKFYPNN